MLALVEDIVILYTAISIFSIICLGVVVVGDAKMNKKLKEKKVRKLYHLESQDVQFVREYAEQKGVSESEVIRLSVRTLQECVKDDPFEEMIGSVKAGKGQAEKHDEVIYECC